MRKFAKGGWELRLQQMVPTNPGDQCSCPVVKPKFNIVKTVYVVKATALVRVLVEVLHCDFTAATQHCSVVYSPYFQMLK